MSQEASLFSRASTEIVDLHRFFVDWFVAARADAVEFGRFEAAMGEGLPAHALAARYRLHG